jgi:hypothetical protein
VSDSDDVAALRERAKELRCLYDVGAALARREDPPQVAFAGVLAAIPSGWQHSDDTTCRIEYFGRTHAREDFAETPWKMRAPILVVRVPVGTIEVAYRHEHPPAFEDPFLAQERELLDRIARRLGEFLEWKHRELGGERIGADPEYWRWRERFAERIAARLDPARFGVERVYLFGSTQSGEAGVSSDIDLMIVHVGDERSKHDLQLWLEGWSLCLAEASRQLTGLPSEGLLDAHVVDATEAEARLRALERNGAPARELPLGVAIAPR